MFRVWFLLLSLFLSTAAFAQFGGPGSGVNPTCPTRPPADSSNACASTAFVHGVFSGGFGTYTWQQLSSIPTGGLAVYVCGYAYCGDGGAALLVVAQPLLRPHSGWSGCATSGQCVQDAKVVSGSNVLESNTATFLNFDVTRPISDNAGFIPNGTTITSVTDVQHAVMSNNATGSVINTNVTAANSITDTSCLTQSNICYQLTVGSTTGFVSTGTVTVTGTGIPALDGLWKNALVVDGTHIRLLNSTVTTTGAVSGTIYNDNDTVTFGAANSNNPGYTVSLDGYQYMYDPTQQLTPQMFGAVLSPATNIDSGASLQRFLDAVTTNSAYGSCGWIGTKFYSTIPLTWSFSKNSNPCIRGSNEGSGVINFALNTPAPNFLIHNPCGRGGFGGGGNGNSISCATFSWKLDGVQFTGNTNGAVFSMGDAFNNDAANDAFVSVSASNGLWSGTGCIFHGLFNIQNLRFNCSTAKRPSIWSVTDGVISGGNQFSSATLAASANPLSASDNGAFLNIPTNCPAGTTILSVTAGVATLSASCPNATGLTAHIDSGIAAQFVNVDSASFNGICASSNKCLDFEDYLGYAVKDTFFTEIDMDGTPGYGVWSGGPGDFANTLTAGNSVAVDWLVCGAVPPTGAQYHNVLFNFHQATSIKQDLAIDGACPYTPVSWFMYAPGQNLSGGTQFLPNPAVTSTQYWNVTGQAAMVYGKAQTQTGVYLAAPTTTGPPTYPTGYVQYIPSGVSNWQLYVPPGYTFFEICSACGSTLTTPAY